ncbi:hypothetical protein DPMN_115190 [Dreissena polymorpha]|uniref:Uncharacterized protein n=1 Tax=Dreissena polymorpha TaxID=45954 RepID=A0A9D4KLA2_DREPO|nr:hypothetical protein DPMN_115190 [Dreissena polymorpha]
MHVIDIQDPAHPSRLFRHKFAVAEGFPQAIAICGGEIAVALSAQPDTNNGQVRFFHTYSRNSKATDVALVGNMTGSHLSRVLRKLGLMHVRKKLSQISLCSPHRLIRDDTFRVYGIFRLKEVPFYRKSNLSGKCRP